MYYSTSMKNRKFVAQFIADFLSNNVQDLKKAVGLAYDLALTQIEKSFLEQYYNQPDTYTNNDLYYHHIVTFIFERTKISNKLSNEILKTIEKILNIQDMHDKFGFTLVQKNKAKIEEARDLASTYEKGLLDTFRDLGLSEMQLKLAYLIIARSKCEGSFLPSSAKIQSIMQDK